MNPDEVLVLLGGAAGIAWVNWYFFLTQRRAAGVDAKDQE